MPRSLSRGRRALGTGDGVVRSSSRRRGRRGYRVSELTAARGRSVGNRDYYESGQTTSLSHGGYDGRGTRRRLLLGILLLIVIVIVLVHRSDRRSRNASSSPSSSKRGHRHSGDPLRSFDLVSQATLEHLHADAVLYRHKNTGMKVLAMQQATEDTLQDGVFGIAFRTLPQNSHGTAQVVAKTLQTGSQRFPVKDAWNQIRQGSLQSHFEADTKRDRTEYTVASRTATDLGHAMEVMLDAFFQPNMVKDTWSFRQEAWRLEQSSDGANIFLKGNAFNQAKIDQMHPEEYMNNYLYRKLFPDTPLHNNERGEQQDILKLTHDEVVDFWKTYYHPANANAFCYGSKEMVHTCMSELHINLQEFYPSHEDTVIRDNTIPPYQAVSPHFASKDRMPYATYRDDVDFRVVLSWAINDKQMDHVTQIAWMVIEDLLMGSSAAALAGVVTEKMWGTDLIGRLEREYQQWILTVGVSGVRSEEDVDRVIQELDDTILALISDGFPDDAIVASMNKVEYQLLNEYEHNMPRGVDIFKKLMTNWNYDREPAAALEVDSHMKILRNEVERNGQQYFLDLMKLHMTDNDHKVTLEMYPSIKVAQIHREQEQKFLDDLNKNLAHSEGVALLQESSKLYEIWKTHDSEEDLATIPRTPLKNVPLTGHPIPLKVDPDVLKSGVTVLEHTVDYTNNLGYVDFAIDISKLNFDDIILLPFYSYLSTRCGNTNGDRSAAEFVRRIESRTGGITVEPLVEDIVPFSQDKGYYVPSGQHLVTKLVIRGNSAISNSNSLFHLISDVLMHSDFSDAKLAEQLLLKLIDDMEDDIQVNGHKYTTYRAESLFSLPGFIHEKWYGITQLYEMRKMLADVQSGKWDAYAARFNTMRETILSGSRNGQFLSITADYDTLRGFTPAIRSFVTEGLPPATIGTPKFPDFSQVAHPWVAKGSQRMAEAITAMHRNEAFIVPTRLSHVGKGGQIFDIGEKVSGSNLAVTQYLDGFYLWNELAIQGAHDASALIDMDSGMLVFQSSEDPSPHETNAVYDAAAAFVYNHINSISDLPIEFEAAMVGAVAAIDGPTPQPNIAGYESMRRYFRQEDDEHRRKIREEILGTTKKEVNAMIERLSSWSNARLIVVTNRYFYKQEGEKLSLQECSLKDFSC